MKPYALSSTLSKAIKRIYNNNKTVDDCRTAFQRDRDRIIHSKSFRRLIHKTQVLRSDVGDHYRTRLIHSIEVAQIARSLAFALGLNQDLTETIALAHDIGHGPFGHTGEDVLNELLKDYGGFNHNVHAFRLVTELEKEYYEFDGLNLCAATLEGLVKHNGPILDNNLLFQSIFNFDKKFSLNLRKYASLEAQCAAIADDIAYNSHDIDDALRFGVISIDDLKQVELPKLIIKEIPNIDTKLLGKTIARKQIAYMINDVIRQSSENIIEFNIKSIEDVYEAPQQIICFSEKMQNFEKDIKSFLYKNFYRSDKINNMRDEVEIIIKSLFNVYTKEKSAQDAVDYIAGMTDIFAKKEFEKIKD